MMFVCCHTSRDIPLYLLVRECNVEEYLAIDCKISQFFYTNLTCKFVVFSFLRLLLGSHYTNQNTNIHNKCYRVYRKLGLSQIHNISQLMTCVQLQVIGLGRPSIRHVLSFPTSCPACCPGTNIKCEFKQFVGIQ